MALEINGVLTQVLAETTGTGKAGTWVKRDFVLETTGDKYPKKICFSAWGDKSAEISNYASGTELKVSFEVSSREYNGKWYTDLRAWKIETGSGAGASANYSSGSTSTPSAPKSDAGDGFGVTFSSDDDDSLPF
jgi:hypothetical protein